MPPVALQPSAFAPHDLGLQRCINPPDAERLRSFGGESLIVADAGHLPHIESPRAVNARMVEFLSHVMAG